MTRVRGFLAVGLVVLSAASTAQAAGECTEITDQVGDRNLWCSYQLGAKPAGGIGGVGFESRIDVVLPQGKVSSDVHSAATVAGVMQGFQFIQAGHITNEPECGRKPNLATHVYQIYQDADQIYQGSRVGACGSAGTNGTRHWYTWVCSVCEDGVCYWMLKIDGVLKAGPFPLAGAYNVLDVTAFSEVTRQGGYPQTSTLWSLPHDQMGPHEYQPAFRTLPPGGSWFEASSIAPYIDAPCPPYRLKLFLSRPNEFIAGSGSCSDVLDP